MIQLPSEEDLVSFVKEGLADMGEPFLVREEDAFATALARGRNIIEYGGVTDPIEVAVAVGYSIFRNRHPLVDGNKRAGYWAILLVLAFNGLEINNPLVTPQMVEEMIWFAADGKITEAHLIMGIKSMVHDQRDLSASIFTRPASNCR